MPGPCLGGTGRRPARAGAGAGAQGGAARRADALTREALAHASAAKRSSDFAALLGLLDQHCGPQPGQNRRPTVLVLDNGPVHTSKASLAALAARSSWLTVERLPRHAPELNATENTWHDLKRHPLAHQTFRIAAELDHAIHQAVANLNKERSRMHPCRSLPMAA